MVTGINSPGVAYAPKVTNNRSLNVSYGVQISAAKDEVAISGAARGMHQQEKEITLAKKRVDGATQDLRQERIEEAKKRLQSGFYNQKEIIEAVAGKIARSVNH